jgi:hypothetical protein
MIMKLLSGSSHVNQPTAVRRRRAEIREGAGTSIDVTAGRMVWAAS